MKMTKESHNNCGLNWGYVFSQLKYFIYLVSLIYVSGNIIPNKEVYIILLQTLFSLYLYNK